MKNIVEAHILLPLARPSFEDIARGDHWVTINGETTGQWAIFLNLYQLDIKSHVLIFSQPHLGLNDEEVTIRFIAHIVPFGSDEGTTVQAYLESDYTQYSDMTLNDLQGFLSQLITHGRDRDEALTTT